MRWKAAGPWRMWKGRTARVAEDAREGKEETQRMILALAAALMVAIHVAGVYLGLRGLPITR